MATGPTQDSASQFLAFRLEGRRYAIPVKEVTEVIRLPAMARVPQSPQGLLGLANLRGAVVPVASGLGLLGHAQGPVTDQARAIVLAGQATVALAVDSIDTLMEVHENGIEVRPAEIAALPGEVLCGAFSTAGGVVKILNLQALMAAAFTARSRKISGFARTAPDILQQAAVENVTRLLTFAVAEQEYALPMEDVQEVISAPETATEIPHAENAVRGVIGFRGGLLPLLSLRRLLGFEGAAATVHKKIVVARVGGEIVGLEVDKMTGLLAAPAAHIEDVPEILAARAGGESRIRAIYRGNDGRRLIPILSTDEIFGEELMRKLQAARRSAAVPEPMEETMGTKQFVVFRLGEDEFGLPIAAVEEVLRLPDQITRVPKTPKFLEGVVNLRGQVLPVVDQRKRFAMLEVDDKTGRRLVVVQTARHRAGLIVDSVSDVLRVRDDEIAEAPSLTGEANPLVQAVANLEAAGRIVLLLDPTELLTRAEQGLLDKFVPATAELPTK